MQYLFIFCLFLVEMKVYYCFWFKLLVDNQWNSDNIVRLDLVRPPEKRHLQKSVCVYWMNIFNLFTRFTTRLDYHTRIIHKPPHFYVCIISYQTRPYDFNFLFSVMYVTKYNIKIWTKWIDHCSLKLVIDIKNLWSNNFICHQLKKIEIDRTYLIEKIVGIFKNRFYLFSIASLWNPFKS